MIGGLRRWIAGLKRAEQEAAELLSPAAGFIAAQRILNYRRVCRPRLRWSDELGAWIHVPRVLQYRPVYVRPGVHG